MASNKQWIERVLFKLNELFLEGSDFEDRRWIFDWDDKLSKKQNLENVADEDRAIETLTQAGVIVTRSIDNHYRGQQLRANEELEMAKFYQATGTVLTQPIVNMIGFDCWTALTTRSSSVFVNCTASIPARMVRSQN